MLPEKDMELIEMVRVAGILRPRDLEGAGLERVRLRRLLDKGYLVQVGRGLYTLPDNEFGMNESLAAVCKAVPGGVICLMSALRFHELTTQAPNAVWLAIHSTARAPVRLSIPLRLIRAADSVLTAGVEEHIVGGVKIRVFSAAKTVADCFKHRKKVGLDVAIEALREYRRNSKGTMDEVWKYSGICRVRTVIRPYVEAMS